MINKYVEGYFSYCYYGGIDCVDVVESLVIEWVKMLFNVEFVNV